MPHFNIGASRIGDGFPPLVIAEMSGNHNQDLESAFRIIETAAAAGAHAIKLQTYTAETMTIDVDREEFRVRGGLWDGRTLHDLYQWAHTPWEWHAPLFERGWELGVTVFSTPFDESAVDFLEDLDAPAYKIASFEAIDLPLIRRAASTGKPLIISTGMTDLDEIEEAVEAARDAGCRDLALLHCVSGYPTPVQESNLTTIPDLARRFGLVVGLSDHTLGTTTAVASVALGASIIEKHVTLRRADGGPDAAFSLEPQELEVLCRDTREVWDALGSPRYHRMPSEQPNLVFRRSIYVVEDIKQGEQFSESNIRRIRPGYGLAPKYYADIIGRRASCHIERGTALQWSMVDRTACASEHSAENR